MSSADIVQDSYAYSPLKNEQSEEEEDQDDDEDIVFNPNLEDRPINNSSQELDFDGFLKQTIGEFGLFQQMIVWILCLPTCLLSAFSTFDMIFIGYTPNFNCNVAYSNHNNEEFVINNHLMDNSNYYYFDNHSSSIIVIDKCFYVTNNGSVNITHQCNNFNYDKEYFQRSIVTDWNLVCDKGLVARTIISLLNLATLVAVGYSYVQDRWGRKKAFLLNLVVFLVGSIGSVNATNPLMFAILKFIGGISCMWEIGFVWATEFVGPSKRTLVTTILSVVYGIANMSLALLAWLTQTWTLFGFCTSAPFAILFLFTCFMPESPRWLIAEGKIEETALIIERMARWEKKYLDPIVLRSTLTKLKISIDKSNQTSDKPISVGDFFRSKNLLYKNLLLTFIGLAANQLYYAVAFDSENLYPNFYVAYVLQSVVEAPATFLNLLLLNRYGRIVPLSFSLLLSGTFCLLTWPMTVFSSWYLGVVILTSISRFFVCSGVAICEQLGNELYPTVGRGVGMSVSYVASAVANISIQYLIYSSNYWKVLPLLIMGSFTLLAGFVSLFLPETKGKSLPDTVHQAEAQGSVGWKSFKGHFSCFYLWNSENKLLIDK